MGFRGQIPPSTGLYQDIAGDGQSWKWDASAGVYVPYTPTSAAPVPHWDTFIVANPPAANYPLTYTPQSDSAIVFLADQLIPPNQYTINGSTLTLGAGVTPAAGQELDVHYWTGSPSLWVPASTNGTAAAPKQTGWFAAGFPDPTAYWIWDRPTAYSDAPKGAVYFRRLIQLNSPQTVRIYLSVDDTGEVYLDGTLAVENTAAKAWETTVTADLTLAAGVHWIAMHGEQGAGVPQPDPASDLLAIYSLVNSAPSQLLVHTDATWDCIGYPDQPPDGWPGPW